MLKMKTWLVSLIMLALTAVPVLAGSSDGKPATGGAAEAEPAAAAANPDPSPNLSAIPGNANVAALLGVLVKKGVLEPAEADAIRNAAPEAEFQLLVEALSRKGVLSAADCRQLRTQRRNPHHRRPRRLRRGSRHRRRRGMVERLTPRRNPNLKSSRRRRFRP